MTSIFVHHRVQTAPRQWQRVAAALRRSGAEQAARAGGTLYGIWRSQIGRARDELTVMTVWPNADAAADASEPLLGSIESIRHCDNERLTPVLRGDAAALPKRQGNYAFRWFETSAASWEEFLDLCAAAWPGFEAAYDSQVLGLWRSLEDDPEMRRSLLLTRRPNLAMWERSKIPAGEAEAEVRRQLSRRYDLCDWTCVYTITLLTAEDRDDTVRWT